MTSVATPPVQALDRTRPTAEELAPGSNCRGVLSTVDWRFLVADDAESDVLVLGIPPEAVVKLLAESGRQIVIAAAARRRRDVAGALSSKSFPNVQVVYAGVGGHLPLDTGRFGLVVGLATAMDAPRRSAAGVTEVARVLRAHGSAYVEGNAVQTAWIARLWKRRAGAGAVAGGFWLIRRKGEVRAAIPLQDVAAVAGRFFDDVLYGRSRLARLLAPVAAWLARRGALHYLLPSRALVLRRGSARPFEHLVALGRRHGLDLSRHAAALLARGSFDSNKVAVYFFDPEDRAADVIIKATRTPVFNHRLDTEYVALRRLRLLDVVSAGSFPDGLFLDGIGGLAMLGQRVVPGVPFRVRTTARPDCPVAADAIAWITRLGAGSVRRASVTQMASRFAELLCRLEATYSLTSSERTFLRERIMPLGERAGCVPTVFRHGDAGTWNVLVTHAGKPAFLDWESAELAGPPLWDLFDFLRSFGTWIGRLRGERDATAIYEGAFLHAGPLAALQRDAVRRYTAEVGVERRLVEPLFYACWMQRALREAAWATLPLDKGTYINLLRLCIRGRQMPGLRWLLD